MGGDHTDGAHARSLAGVDFAGRRTQPVRSAVHGAVREGGDRLHVVMDEADQLRGVIDAGDGAAARVDVEDDVLDTGIGRRRDHGIPDLRVACHAHPLVPDGIAVVGQRTLNADGGNAGIVNGEEP